MNKRSGDGRGSYKVDGVSDMAMVSEMVIASTRYGRNLFREGRLCIEDETKVTSRVSRSYGTVCANC